MRKLILILSVLLLPSLALSEPKEIYIEGVVLRIGMTKEEARAVLSKSSHDVKPMGESGGYSITSSAGPPYDFYGSFSFDEKDRINWISREWGTFKGSQVQDLGKALYNCLNKHDGKGFILTTNYGSQPGFAITSIRLSATDGTEISISITDGHKYGEGVGIHESVRAK